MMRRTDFPALGERCYSEDLENGLRVSVLHRPDFAKCFALLAVDFGGMDLRWRQNGSEVNVPSGTAHYLEHKLFDTPDGSALARLAASGAQPNAFTSHSVTAYHITCTGSLLPQLQLLLSFVSNPCFTRASVEKERGIITQEIQMVRDMGDRLAYQSLLESLYLHHPIRVDVAGSVSSIAKITPTTLYRCHSAFYHPENMVLCVAGDVEPEQIAAVVRMVLPRRRWECPERDFGPQEPMHVNRSLHTAHAPLSAPTFLGGLKAEPHPFGEDFLRQQLLGELAGEVLCGESSPLFQALYEKGLINRTFGVTYQSEPEAAFLAFGGSTADPQAVAQLVFDEAVRLGRDGVPQDLFERIRRAAYGSRVRRLNALEPCALRLAEGHLRGYHYYHFPELLLSLTAQDVTAFLARIAQPERFSVSQVLPLDPDESHSV